MRRTDFGPKRRAWEVDGADRAYSIEVSTKGVSFGESGPPPTYGSGGGCSLRRLLGGEQHEWIARHFGPDVLEETLSFARDLLEKKKP